MWFSVVYSLIDNDTRHHSGQNVVSPQYQRNEIFLLTIENTDSDLKVHSLHYANELLVRVRLFFQTLLDLLQTRLYMGSWFILICRNNSKKCLGKT